ncbi:unnamed protein product [Rhizoctonia solani]|uniref:Phosphatidylserine decarboxylase proenzyme 2 n=1 Tax=Rhizoctonia solani TaxID=456999 RepID=A0A8H3HXZ5_9AGAM|nr:unnamed protein product [Rhizoctonia solani]
MAPTTSTKPVGNNKMGIGKVLKNVGKLPKGIKSVKGGRARAKATRLEGELPAVLLKIQIVGCKDLRAADSNGKSDPFVVISFAGQRESTPVINKTLYPEWAPKDATFTFPLYLSTIGSQGSIELVVWDKDLFSKNDYLGEVSLPIEDWFKWNGGNGASFDDVQLPFNERILSTDPKNPASGTMQLKIGFVTPPEVNHPMDFQQAYQQLLNRSIMAGLSLDTAPPTRGIGTLGSGDEAGAFDDDGLSSDDEESDEESAPSSPAQIPSELPPTSPLNFPRKDSTSHVQPQPQPQPKPRFTRLLSNVKRPSFSRQDSSASSATTGKSDSNNGTTTPKPRSDPATHEKKKTRRSRKHRSKDQDADYQLDAGADIQGIVMIEVSSANDLPKLKNVTRTGWDMDPFVVISFSKKVFRTRVIRHSRTPVWDEKLLFHVRRHETNFRINFSVLDWDKMSGNDHVGDVSLDLPDLMQDLPARNPNTGLYPLIGEHAESQLKTFTLDLAPGKDLSWEGKHKPTLTIKAKYQPYDALRQRFWLQYLQQYDADNTGLISHIELTSMLDSLGSTLSAETLNGFFSRFNKNPDIEELTFDEAVQCLEEELAKPTADRRKVVIEEHSGLSTGTTTPLAPGPFITSPGTGLDFTGLDAPPPPGRPQTDINQVPHETNQTVIDPNNPAQYVTMHAGSSDEEDSSSSSASDFERVINIKTCPLCHRPRLKGKSEADIVTHLAVCASGDWASVDRIVVGNFVTASQAQRKWYTKMLTKITAGDISSTSVKVPVFA